MQKRIIHTKDPDSVPDFLMQKKREEVILWRMKMIKVYTTQSRFRYHHPPCILCFFLFYQKNNHKTFTLRSFSRFGKIRIQLFEQGLLIDRFKQIVYGA